MSQKHNTFFIGKVLEHRQEVRSTNEFALNLVAKSNPIEGTIITSDFQTAGRGQLNNGWESAAGQNLLISIVLFPHFLAPKNQFLLNQVVSLGLNDCVQQFVSKEVSIKWSNDCFVSNKKVAGVLIQNSLTSKMIQSSVIGIGLNVNQRIFTSNAPNPTSLALVTKTTFLIDDVRDALCYHIEKWYLKLKSGKEDLIRSTYLSKLYLKDQLAMYERADGTRFEGEIKTLDDIGRLQILINGSIETFGFKEVKFLHNN